MNLRLLPYQEHHLKVNKLNFCWDLKHSGEILQEVTGKGYQKCRSASEFSQFRDSKVWESWVQH